MASGCFMSTAPWGGHPADSGPPPPRVAGMLPSARSDQERKLQNLCLSGGWLWAWHGQGLPQGWGGQERLGHVGRVPQLPHKPTTVIGPRALMALKAFKNDCCLRYPPDGPGCGKVMWRWVWDWRPDGSQAASRVVAWGQVQGRLCIYPFSLLRQEVWSSPTEEPECCE